jgi:hypothetical protein
MQQKRLKSRHPEVARIKQFRERLGLKLTELRKKLREHLEAMKETQRSLGFTGKDVDDRGLKLMQQLKRGRAKEIASYWKILLCQV